MRYFFVSYTASNKLTVAVGNLYFGSNMFPSNEFLRATAFDKSGKAFDQITITGLFEFKNQEDYESFIKETEFHWIK